MPRVRIRTSLLTLLMSLILALVAALLFVNHRAGKAIAEDLGGRYLDKTRDVVVEKLGGFFLPVMTGIRNGRAWARSHVVEPKDMHGSNKVYLPVLEAMPQVTSIATGNTGGYSYRLGAKGDNYLNRLTYAGEKGRPADYFIVTPEGEVLEEYSKATKFDPRKRPWYAGARKQLELADGDVANTKMAWTDPFILNTSKNPGIAASLPYEGPGNDVYMMTFNVMLTKLSNFTASLRPTPNSMAMVLTKDGRIVGFPATEEYNTAEKRLAHVKALGNRMPELHEVGQPSLAGVRKLYESIEATGKPSRRRLEIDGEAWRVQFEPYTLEQGPPLWIGVVVPEADFLGQVKEQQRNILWVSGLALLIALGLAALMARMYGRPLRQLAKESERIRSLDLSPGKPIESHVLETHLLAGAQENMRTALESFSKYIPTEVVRELLRRGEAAKLGGEAMPVTILFTDIRGFTTISEGMSNTDLSEHLSAYFEGMLEIIREEHGVVDKMVGDAIMAMWGAPVERDDHGAGAVRAALRCASFVEAFNARCEAQGRPPLWTGFGIASGRAFVGNFGSPSRLNFTALGDVVNLAARLEGANKVFGSTILCSKKTRDQSADEFEWLRLHRVGVKGKTKPEPVYQPLGRRGDVPDDVLSAAKSYERALTSYTDARFGDALAALEEIDASNPLYAVSMLLTAKCMEQQKQDSAEAFDDVWWLSSK